jgi:hypothetical protein
MPMNSGEATTMSNRRCIPNKSNMYCEGLTSITNNEPHGVQQHPRPALQHELASIQHHNVSVSPWTLSMTASRCNSPPNPHLLGETGGEEGGSAGHAGQPTWGRPKICGSAQLGA